MNSRKTLKYTIIISIFVISIWSSSCIKSPKELEKKVDNLQYVDPTIGNVGHMLQPTRPTVQLPNQALRMYLMRDDHLDDHQQG